MASDLPSPVLPADILVPEAEPAPALLLVTSGVSDGTGMPAGGNALAMGREELPGPAQALRGGPPQRSGRGPLAQGAPRALQGGRAAPQ